MHSVPSHSANKPHDSDYSRNRARSIRFLVLLTAILALAFFLSLRAGSYNTPAAELIRGILRPGVGREDQSRHPQQPPAAHLHRHGRRRGTGAGRVHPAGRAAQSAGLGLYARRVAGCDVRRSRRHHRSRPEPGRQLGYSAVLVSRLAACRGRHSGAEPVQADLLGGHRARRASPSAPC